MAATKYLVFCRYIHDKVGKVITNSVPQKWISAEYFNNLKRIFYTYRRIYMYTVGGNVCANYKTINKKILISESPEEYFTYSVDTIENYNGNDVDGNKVKGLVGARININDTLSSYYYNKCNEYIDITTRLNNETDNTYSLEYCDIYAYNYDPSLEVDPIYKEEEIPQFDELGNPIMDANGKQAVEIVYKLNNTYKDEVKRRNTVNAKFNDIIEKENVIDNPKYDMLFIYEGLSHNEFLGWEVYDKSGDKVLYDFNGTRCKIAKLAGFKTDNKENKIPFYNNRILNDGIPSKPYCDTYINDMKNITLIRELEGSLDSSGINNNPPRKIGYGDKINTLFYPYLVIDNPVLFNIKNEESPGESSNSKTSEPSPEIYFDKMKRLPVQPWCKFCICNSLRAAIEKTTELSKIMEIKHIKVGKEVPLDQYIDIV